MSMRPKEQEKFLEGTKCIARICTHDKDGSIHIVPVWYTFEAGELAITSDANSHHVKNITKNSSSVLKFILSMSERVLADRD